MTDTEPQQRAEAVVVASTDLLLPEGQRFFTEQSMFPLDKAGLPKPHFSIHEAAKSFFGSGPDWLRWRLRGDTKRIKQPDGSFITQTGDYPNGWFILDGELMEFARTNAGARVFSLADIERMAHALAQQNVIDGARLANIVLMVKTCAKMHGFIS